MNGLTDREQRLLALALLMGMIAAAWFAVASPILRGFSERQATREAAQSDLERNARLISAFGAVRAQALAARQSAPVYAFTGADPVAQARNRVVSAVDAGGGMLQALRNQSAPARQVRLQAEMRIGLSGLADLIRRLENDRPYATVNGLFITAADTAGAGSLSPLEVRLDISYSYAAAR